MSLYNDIEKATHIPCTDDGACFVRLKGSSKSKQNELNKRRPKPPRNVNLLEDDSLESYGDAAEDYAINENEIAASIKVANGGVSYSNELLENHWKSTQLDNSNTIQSDTASSKNSSFGSRSDNNSTYSCTENNNDIRVSNVKTKDHTDLEEKMKVLGRCKLSKNAAILGLLKSDKISLKDLQVPNDGNCANAESTKGSNVKSENGLGTSTMGKDKYKMQLVECPEDSGVLVQPLQAYGTIDENRCRA